MNFRQYQTVLEILLTVLKIMKTNSLFMILKIFKDGGNLFSEVLYSVIT